MADDWIEHVAQRVHVHSGGHCVAKTFSKSFTNATAVLSYGCASNYL